MSDFQFANADELNNLGSASVRYKQNIEALTILRALKEHEGTTPSEADLRTLTRYVGWGASELINKAFPRSSWGEPTKEIEALLTQDEIDTLRSSSLSAFFTPLPIIAAIYDALDYLGLSKLPSLRILDPAAGTGHFIGAMPTQFRQNYEYVAVEPDRVSASMALPHKWHYGAIYEADGVFASKVFFPKESEVGRPALTGGIYGFADRGLYPDPLWQ